MSEPTLPLSCLTIYQFFNKKNPLGKALITKTNKTSFRIYKQLVFLWVNPVVGGDSSNYSINMLA
jgi:hypothetical protein